MSPRRPSGWIWDLSGVAETDPTAPAPGDGHGVHVSAKPPIRVYVLEGHDLVRRGIVSLLADEPDVEIVGQTGRAATAVRELAELEPDVAVLDARAPDGFGVDVCRAVRERAPTVKTMILTNQQDDEAVSAAILAGASGYVHKQIEGGALLSAIRLVATGHSLIDRAAAARGMETVAFHRRTGQVVADLTPQQTRILALIADGLTNREIAERMVLAEKTVKNHVTALLSRLGVAHRTQAAVIAQRLRREASAPSAEPTRCVSAQADSAEATGVSRNTRI